MESDEEVLAAAYRGFNARDIDAVLKLMHVDVDWPNGMTGGRVHGHAEVREYWTWQWDLIDPKVDPVSFHREADGRVAVMVHQVVHDREGLLLMDRLVDHVYAIDGGLIQSMEIRERLEE